MFDLLKKKEINSLNAIIAELEDENRKLVTRLEKKDEKTRKAVAEKQEVDRELNEARHKLLSLGDELHKLKKEGSCELKFRFSKSLSRHEFDEVIYLLGSLESKTSTMVTIYLAGGDTLKNIPHDIASLIDGASLTLIEKIESSTGKAIFYDTNHVIKLVIIPFLPILHHSANLERKFDIGLLKKTHEFDKLLALNTHAGETFAGIVEAGVFVEHEIIRSSVMGKHKQGGWSQKRFQSLVEEDVRHHADKVRIALSRIIGEHKDIQYIIAGGDGKLVRMILEGYNYPLIIKSMDAGSDAGQVLTDVMAVRMYGI